MFYFVMSLLSENPSGGPQMFGLLCDAFAIAALIYGIISAIRKR